MRMRYFRAACVFLLMITALTVTCGAGAEKSILFTFTGDCTLGSEERTGEQETSFVTVAKKKGYDYFFANMRELFEQDDLTIINLEGVLSDSKNQENKSKTYRFRGPTEYVRILTGSSIEVCNLANNHLNDFGKQGEERTKATLEENGIGWFREYDYYIYEKDGIRIAFIGLENRTVFNEIAKVNALMATLKESGEANAIVVCWHTGREYRGAHEDGTQKICEDMIRNGADLIINMHPHVLQGISLCNNRCIFYSLGNFVFGGNDRIRTEKFKLDKTVSTLYTVALQVRMQFSDDGKYLGQHPVLYPVYTSSTAPINNYQPYRVNAQDAIPVLEALQEDTDRKKITLSISVGKDGLSMIDLGYIAAFDGVAFPDSDNRSLRGAPEAADPAPSRETKSN